HAHGPPAPHGPPSGRQRRTALASAGSSTRGPLLRSVPRARGIRSSSASLRSAGCSSPLDPASFAGTVGRVDTRRLAFVREQIEAAEETRLSPYAVRSAHSRGRQVPEEPHPLRTAFQRDRDRILHAKAFRRLAHKTQVFLAPEGDHLRVRLTHT